MTIVWGMIAGDGTPISGSGNFTVMRTDPGKYMIIFSTRFAHTPAIVGSQCGFGQGESTLDNVVFPAVSHQSVEAKTGGSDGSDCDRQFSFIAIGLQGD